MNEGIVGLSIAYVAVAALLTALMIYSRWPFWLKAANVVLVGALYFVTYAALKDLLGWPAGAELPDRFMLLASQIEEPDKTAGTDGRIYVWAVSIRPDNRPADKPRAYAVGYDTELHSQLSQAEQRMRRGIVQLGRKDRSGFPGLAVDRSRRERAHTRFVIFDLPDPELPEK